MFHSAGEPIHYQIIDRLYRISEKDFAQLWSELFGVKILSGTHWINGNDEVVSFGTRVTDALNDRYPYNRRHGVHIVISGSRLLFVWESEKRGFNVDFSGSEKALSTFKRELNRFQSFYTSVFIYYFNRVRAANELHSEVSKERGKFEMLAESLKDNNSNIDRFLAELSMLANAEYATISVYSELTQKLVTVNVSNNSNLDPDLIRGAELSKETHSILLESGFFERALSPDSECPKCREFEKAGIKHAQYFPITRTYGESRTIRAIVSLYSRIELSKENTRMLNLYLAIRQLAQFITELDTYTERRVPTDVLSYANEACGNLNASRNYGDIMINTLEKVKVGLISATERVLGSNFDPNSIHCALAIGSEKIDPDSIFKIEELKEYVSSSNQPLSASTHNSQSLVIARSSEEEKIKLCILADTEVITCLSEGLYSQLATIISIVYQFIVNERRRISWIGKTMHEVRQPLQGLVVVADEIRRMAEIPTVSRRELANFAEDMGYSTLRLKAIMHHLSDSTGRKIIPRLRRFLFEDHVLRPIRRVLEAPAREKNLTISKTYGYSMIPELISDPDLLSLIIYNIFDNALKYSEDNSEIRVLCDRDSDGAIYVDFINRGSPIRHEERDKIFNEGYRGEEVKMREVGLGLGLWTCRRISSMLGLDIKYISFKGSPALICFRISGFEKIRV